MKPKKTALGSMPYQPTYKLNIGNGVLGAQSQQLSSLARAGINQSLKSAKKENALFKSYFDQPNIINSPV